MMRVEQYYIKKREEVRSKIKGEKGVGVSATLALNNPLNSPFYPTLTNISSFFY